MRSALVLFLALAISAAYAEQVTSTLHVLVSRAACCCSHKLVWRLYSATPNAAGSAMTLNALLSATPCVLDLNVKCVAKRYLVLCMSNFPFRLHCCLSCPVRVGTAPFSVV